MNAFQKSIENVRMTCPMIYQTQEKLSESFQGYSEANFYYSTTEPGQKDVGPSSLIESILGKNSKQFPKLQMQLVHAQISMITDRKNDREIIEVHDPSDTTKDVNTKT